MTPQERRTAECSECSECPSESGQHLQELIMRMKSRWFATAVSASFRVDDAGTMAPESRCRCGTGELPLPGPSQGKRRISHAAGRPLCPTKRQVNGHDSSRRGMDLAFHGAPGSPSADVGGPVPGKVTTASQHPEVEHRHGVVRKTRRDLVAPVVPANFENPAFALERFDELAVFDRPYVEHFIERA